MYKMSKMLQVALGILSIAILLNSMIILEQQIQSNPDEYKEKIEVSFINRISCPAYISHTPILIDTNSDFSLKGFPGNGSLVNPYRISGLNITTTGVCIRIQDTTAHFIISDCYLSGGTANNGIELSYVTNGVIMNNTISEKYDGIQTGHASYTTIFNNTIFSTSWIGVSIYQASNHNVVANNTISVSSGQGVYLSQSCYYNIVGNNTIAGTLSENTIGVAVLACANNLIKDNILTNHGHHGIWMSGSNHMDLVNNTIIDNNNGVTLASLDDSTITNNTIIENVLGIELITTSDNNTIYRNIIAYNDNSASDNSRDNMWNLTNCGNYWSDYTGTGVYNISGEAGSIDYHPFSYDTRPPTIDHPADIIFEKGTTGHDIAWNASDSHPSHYVVFDNETELISHSWDGALIIVTLDSLSVGAHFVVIGVYDAFGNSNTDTVIVSVLSQETTTDTITTSNTTSSSGIPSFDTMLLILISSGVIIIIVVIVTVKVRR